MVNKEYEATMPASEKPNADTKDYQVERFIRAKYEEKRWYKPLAQENNVNVMRALCVIFL